MDWFYWMDRNNRVDGTHGNNRTHRTSQLYRYRIFWTGICKCPNDDTRYYDYQQCNLFVASTQYILPNIFWYRYRNDSDEDTVQRCSGIG